MRSKLAVIFAALPWLLLIAYGALIAQYSKHLDSDLKYVQPAVPGAPEDILGFGFWLPWGVILVVIAALTGLVYKLSPCRPPYYLALGATFVAMSAVDFFLFQTLARQVLGQ